MRTLILSTHELPADHPALLIEPNSVGAGASFLRWERVWDRPTTTIETRFGLLLTGLKIPRDDTALRGWWQDTRQFIKFYLQLAAGAEMVESAFQAPGSEVVDEWACRQRHELTRFAREILCGRLFKRIAEWDKPLMRLICNDGELLDGLAGFYAVILPISWTTSFRIPSLNFWPEDELREPFKWARPAALVLAQKSFSLNDRRPGYEEFKRLVDWQPHGVDILAGLQQVRWLTLGDDQTGDGIRHRLMTGDACEQLRWLATASAQGELGTAVDAGVANGREVAMVSHIVDTARSFDARS